MLTETKQDIQFLGEPLWAEHAESAIRLATVFPAHWTIVTLPGIHATQRDAFLQQLDRQRQERGWPCLSDEEQEGVLQDSVDLIIKGNKILIRPDPSRMDLAFAADVLLQRIAPKRSIRFLYVSDPRVRDAIRRRGEAWRIHPLPQSPEAIKKSIQTALISVSGRPIYYYNAAQGSRILTFEQFARLGQLDDAELRQHLCEISKLCNCNNARGYPELKLFMNQRSFSAGEFSNVPWAELKGGDLRSQFFQARSRFEQAVPPEYRRDLPDDGQSVALGEEWRNRMYAALIGRDDDELSESDLLGLAAEFFMQIQWLPGARLEGGELVFDMDDDAAMEAHPSLSDEEAATQTLVHGLICNLMQEYGDIEYVNIGHVLTSLCKRAHGDGRREVYVAHFRHRGATRETLRIIRMQKFGVGEHLDEGQDLLRSMIEAEDYTDYIMDRRLGCRQLGMNLPNRVSVRKVSEIYRGKQTELHGTRIWSAYFDRDYIAGLATDKIPEAKLRDAQYAAKLAMVMGAAAAPNLIVGRCDLKPEVLFDFGDEIVQEDPSGMPSGILVSNHTGTFNNYKDDLLPMAAAYANAVNDRLGIVPNGKEFAKLYLEAFKKRFEQIQTDYRARRRAFDGLFKHRVIDPAGNFAFRWRMVLGRLDEAEVKGLVREIERNIRV